MSSSVRAIAAEARVQTMARRWGFKLAKVRGQDAYWLLSLDSKRAAREREREP